MNGPKKEISVDDILNEYAQMAGGQTPPKKPHTTIEPGGDQVWRPEPHRAQQESQRNTDPQPVMPSSAGQSANRKKAPSAGSRGARSAAPSAAKKKHSLWYRPVERIRNLANPVVRRRKKPVSLCLQDCWHLSWSARAVCSDIRI